MPIYAYKCSDCGHEKEVLQKISDAPLTDCPDCGQATMVKMVTAAGFQLKGSGWYVTDFRNKDAGGKGKANGKSDGKSETASGGASDSKSDSGSSTAAASATSTHACGGGCACS
jgi:putative FmdB family regulatory protein